MKFDTNNKIVKLCADGMMFEGKGDMEKAFDLFHQAWKKASTNFEKFTAAHYVARHQNSIRKKLQWDKKALQYAQKIPDPDIQSVYPSLYLNIAKGYEELKDFDNAMENYQLAHSYTNHLSKDGYGKMIKRGITSGIDRLISNLGARIGCKLTPSA